MIVRHTLSTQRLDVASSCFLKLLQFSTRSNGLAVTARSRCSDSVHAGGSYEASYLGGGGDNYGDAPGLDLSDIPSLLISILGWGRFLSIPGSNSGWRRACLFK